MNLDKSDGSEIVVSVRLSFECFSEYFEYNDYVSFQNDMVFKLKSTDEYEILSLLLNTKTFKITSGQSNWNIGIVKWFDNNFVYQCIALYGI